MTADTVAKPAARDRRQRGNHLFGRGLLKAAIEEFQVWLDEAVEVQDNLAAAQAENALGVSYLEESMVEKAVPRFQEARRRLSKGPVKDPDTLAKAEANLGSALWRLGQFARAERHLRRALSQVSELGDEVLQGRILMWLGGLHLDQGSYHDALGETNQALIRFERTANRYFEAMACNNLGIAHGALGQNRRGQVYLERALALAKGIGDQKLAAYTYTEMARIYYLQGDQQLAMHFCNQSLIALFSDVNALDREEVGQVSLIFSLIFEAMGQPSKAMVYARRAAQYFSKLKVRAHLAEAEAVVRRLRSRTPEPARAMEGHCRQAVEEVKPAKAEQALRALYGRPESPLNPEGPDGEPDAEFAEQELRFHYLDTFLRFADAIEAKDPYTRGHSERVTAYALKIAEAMGLSGKDRDVLSLAGRLHDVGKVSVDTAILNKPGALTEEEYAAIRRHPEIGADMTRFILTSESAVSLVKHHHERYDGTGYPGGLRGDAIPLLTRILSVADAYDAMTTDRAYRQAYPHSLALLKLKDEAGRQFDPEVIAAFERLHQVD
ncbi:MAG TPA: HD domain-containing phosphohydrolase [Bacillota bacterium]